MRRAGKKRCEPRFQVWLNLYISIPQRDEMVRDGEAKTTGLNDNLDKLVLFFFF